MSVRTGVEDLLRELAPQVLAVLVRRCGDFADAEDAVQEALLAAASQWPDHGLPGNPRGWLITVAARRLTDIWRADQARRHREDLVVGREPTMPAEPSSQDDSLLLLFLCCHPVLTPSSAIPLTLRAVGGLTTAQIAAAFLVPEDTMAKRISPAKQRIKPRKHHSAYPPPRPTGPGGCASSCTCSTSSSTRGTPPAPARRSPAPICPQRRSGSPASCTRHCPDDPEVAGLPALMLLTDARRPARTGPAGQLIPLAEQDRTRWNQALIAEGVTLLDAVLPRRAVGEYQLQAAIAAIHDEAASAEATDWPQILALYTLLEAMTGNPMATLNRAIAIAMVHGPAAGLAALVGLGDRLAGHHRLDAVRAHLLEMAGDTGSAISHYPRAAGRTTAVGVPIHSSHGFGGVRTGRV